MKGGVDDDEDDVDIDSETGNIIWYIYIMNYVELKRTQLKTHKENINIVGINYKK